MYIVTYHFYVKYNYSDYHNEYNIDPVKEFFKLRTVLPNLEKDMKSQNQIKFQQDLDICTRFISNDEIYLPFSACLISTTINAEALEKCLEYLMNVYFTNEKMFYEVLNHLIYEVPIPPKNTIFNIYLPFNKRFKLNGSLDKERFPHNYPTNILLSYFSPENIILIHHL